jgi:hypothetical protein
VSVFPFSFSVDRCLSLRAAQVPVSGYAAVYRFGAPVYATSRSTEPTNPNIVSEPLISVQTPGKPNQVYSHKLSPRLRAANGEHGLWGSVRVSRCSTAPSTSKSTGTVQVQGGPGYSNSLTLCRFFLVISFLSITTCSTFHLQDMACQSKVCAQDS